MIESTFDTSAPVVTLKITPHPDRAPGNNWQVELLIRPDVDLAALARMLRSAAADITPAP